MKTFAEFAGLVADEPSVADITRVPRGTGFQVQTRNGWTVSVQFGPLNYCDNYHNHDDLEARWTDAMIRPIGPEVDVLAADCLSRTTTAEIAYFTTREGGLCPFPEGEDGPGDVVKGYVPVDDVLVFIRELAERAPVCPENAASGAGIL